MDTCNLNFEKLLALLPRLRETDSARITVPGAACLFVNVLSRRSSTAMLSLIQYCEHPLGHVVADPSMIIAVDAEAGTVEALVFQNHLGIRRSYFDETAMFSNPSMRMQMNQFLGQWLSNLISARGLKEADMGS